MNKRTHLKKIRKVGLITFIISLTIVVGIYIYSPRIIYKRIGKFAIVILHAAKKDQPYGSKYGVHPFLLGKVELVIDEAKAKGIDLRVIRGYRSLEMQQELYDQGRITKGGIVTNAQPGYSFHNYGWAVDVCEYTDGNLNWQSKRWEEIGEIGKTHGLTWGGDWKHLVDKPHFQLSLHDIRKHCIF